MLAKMELKRLVSDYQINQAFLAKRAHRSHGHLTGRLCGSKNIGATTIERYLQQLNRVGHELLQSDLGTTKLTTLLNRVGLRLSWVAARLGISRQALWEAYTTDRLSPERTKEIQAILHDAGRHILKTTKEIESKLGQ